ncbi:MAG TPA: phosphoadenosine phosphosulfate reductase family protein [Desulfosporosinus sp.]|nr:phosphoadenosine phosphosulfate reductase family protein [Desulfosporosinus sp.]
MRYIKDTDCTRNTPVTLGHPKEPMYETETSITPNVPGKMESKYDKQIFLENLLPLEEYDLIVVLFSGGKDSMAAYWVLRELGVPKEKMELWHHNIDGGHPERTMDWPVTQAYNQAFAEAEGVTLRTSWRVNGFFGELYRVGASYPIEYEDGEEVKTCRLSERQQRSEQLREQILAGLAPGIQEELKSYGLRMKFPAKSGDLARRWCSAYLKIDVADTVIRNLRDLNKLGNVNKFPAKGSIGSGRWCSPQLKREVADSVVRNLEELQELGCERHKFPAKSGCHQGRWCSGALNAQVQGSITTDINKTKENVKVLIVSGERRGESAGRAKYNEMEVHRTNATAKAHRLVHQWRSVIDYSERDIWEVLRRHGITPHPCYSAGWNRCSCMMCIFSLPRHWVGIKELFPNQYQAMRQDEIDLDFTIDNKKSLDEYTGDAESCVSHANEKALLQLRTGEFTKEDIYTPTYVWDFPAGAFRGSDGGPC